MARTWHVPDQRDSWWRRHWANPNFSGSLIALLCVLVVVAVGVYIGVQELGLTWSDLDVARLTR